MTVDGVLVAVAVTDKVRLAVDVLVALGVTLGVNVGVGVDVLLGVGVGVLFDRRSNLAINVSLTPLGSV